MFKLLRENLSLADVLLFALILLGVVLSARVAVQEDNNKMVCIYKDNALLGIYSIDTMKNIKIDEHNTVRIENHKVRMVYADCPDKRCVRQGPGDVLPIICLPNHVVVEIHSGHREQMRIVR